MSKMFLFYVKERSGLRDRMKQKDMVREAERHPSQIEILPSNETNLLVFRFSLRNIKRVAPHHRSAAVDFRFS